MRDSPIYVVSMCDCLYPKDEELIALFHSACDINDKI